MARTVAVKEAEVVAAAITIIFPHCNNGITEDNDKSRTDIFSSIYALTFLILRITP